MAHRTLGRLRLIHGVVFFFLAVGLVAMVVDPPGVRYWILASWIGASVTTVAGWSSSRRALVLHRAELERHEEAELRAEAADRAKNEFLANMSHEVRTPINAALGMAELLLEMDLVEEARRRVEVIQASGEALLTLTDDILDFARIEAGKLQLTLAPFDLHELVEQSARILRVRSDEKGLRFVSDIRPEVPQWVLGDAGRLRQILLNLGSNAVKFTDDGEVGLRVTIVEHDGEPRVSFRVHDTGIGVAAQDQRRIFETFAQADSSSARRAGGTGLGLAISSELVSLMGGKIGLDSERGVGSTFWFEVPLLPAPPVSAAAPEIDEETKRRRRATVIVLVVDDHAANRMVAVSRLETLGYRAEAVGSGEEALERLAAGGVDAVLMDCQMPVVDGYETTRRLRAREVAGGRTPVVAMTALAMREDRQRCLDAGMDEYLSKPFRSADLAKILDRLMFGDDAGKLPLADIPGGALETETMAALRAQGLLQSTITQLVEIGARHLDDLHRVVDEGETDEATRLAHTLGGSVLAFGAAELAALCDELEERLEVRVPSSDLDGALMEEIAATWQRFVRDLTEMADDEPRNS